MANNQRFRLNISVQLQVIDPQYGHPMSGGLEIREQADLTLDNFMEVAGVLSRFHELVEAMKVDPHAYPVWEVNRGG